MLLYRESVISRLLTEIVDIENKNVQEAYLLKDHLPMEN